MRHLVLWVLLSGPLHAQTVLVLPFFNQSKSPGVDWIGESISEAIHDALSSEGVLVLDREDRLEIYARLSLRPGAELTRASIIKAGQTADASNVVYGSYQVLPPQSGSELSKGSVRVTGRVLNLKLLSQTPEFSEVGALEDLAKLQRQLSWQVLRLLNAGAQLSEEEFVRARPAVRLDAAESYIRGLLAQNPDQKQRLFMQAARLDEHYSPPCFQLGKAAWLRKDYQAALSWLVRVDRADPHYLEAQFLLGLCRYYTGDFAGAEQTFQLVATAIPLNEAFNNLGAAQGRRNNTAAAITNFKKALEGDSSDPDYYFNLGYEYWKLGRFAEAVDSFRAAVARNPSDNEATVLLGRALSQQGPRPGESRLEGRERLKVNYEERAYRQLQAELKSKR